MIRCGLPLIAAGLVLSCDSPQKQAMRQLTTAGIAPTGRALLDAVGRRDPRTVELLLAAGVHTEQRDPAGRTPLRIAVDQRDHRLVTSLLAAGVRADTATPDQTSALGAAVAGGGPGLVEALLHAGARADGRMPGGEKILPWAIREGRLELVEMMMRAGADPHIKDQRGNPVLQVAIACGRRDIARALLALGADPGAVNATGEDSVHLALRHGWADFIGPLIAAGADPNAVNPEGLTPLLRMVRSRNAGLCKLLLERGADPGIPDPAGLSPLDEAVTATDAGLLQLILQSTAGRTIRHGDLTPRLRRATGLRWLEGMTLLAAAGADPNAPDAAGQTPVEAACAANDMELLGWLLGLRADPARRDAGGRLLVERATAAGRGSLVKSLLDYGSPPGRSLAIACARGDGNMARLLLACGVPPDGGPGPLMDNPLASALRTGDDELAATLAGFGRPANQRLPEGQTLLHLAIVRGCHRTVKLLLDAGADPNLAVASPVSDEFIRHVRPGTMVSLLRNDRNLTPLMLAADAGVPQTVQYLLAAGAKRNVWTRVNRLWPINLAVERGRVEVMRAMLGQDPDHEERRIVISLSGQEARMYDASGREMFTTKVSTGRKGYATRTGDFVITDKNRTWTSTIYHVSMPYFQRLSCSDFGLHQGYVPGYPASHGCIRVPPGKAAELFRLTKTGDRVQIIP